MATYSNNSLRIGVILHAPASTPCSLDPTCNRRGYGVDAALIVCQILTLNCTFRVLEETQNGNLTGVLMNEIAKGTFDTSLPVFMPSDFRMDTLHFSHSYFYGDAVLVTRSFKATTDLDLSVFRSFQWPLWCAFGFSYVCLFALRVCGRRSKNALYEKGNTTSKNLNKRFFDWRGISERIILLTCLLLVFMLNSSYTGVTYSNKMYARSKAPFHDVDSFISCVWNKKCRLIGAPSSASLSWLMSQSSSNSRHGLADALKKNPIKYSPRRDILDEVYKEKDVYLSTIMPRDAFNDLSKSNRKCRYYVVNAPYLDMGCFPMPKSWRFRNEFDRMARYFQEFGIAKALEQKYRLKGDLCIQGREFGSPPMPVLIVKAIYSVLVFYAVGTLIAGGVFLLETFVFKSRNRTRIVRL